MNTLRQELDSPRPSIAAVFSQNLEEHVIKAALSRADVAEFRADKFRSSRLENIAEQIRRISTVPVLLTVRSAEEGGDWDGSEQDRANLVTDLAPMVQGVDIELSAKEINQKVTEVAHDIGLVVIGSMHDFAGLPDTETLLQQLEMSEQLDADYTKLAVTVNTLEDYQRLADFTSRYRDRGLIVVAMGNYGPLSRVSLPALGSHLTYAATGNLTVPGQMTIADTYELIRRTHPAELFN